MKKYSMETTVGVFVFAGLLCIVYMAVRLGGLELFSSKYYSLFARFSSVNGLRIGSPVEMLGLQIGKVTGLSMNQDEQVAIAELKIARDVRVYDDAIASIRTSGLIGDKFVRIDAGGAGAQLQAGGMIVDTEPAVDLWELISKYALGDVGKKQEKQDLLQSGESE